MNPFQFDKYYAKKKFWKLFGGEVRIFDESKQNLLFFVKQKAFKIKEDISIFSDEDKSTELLRIRTQSIFDIAGTYDITDSSQGDAPVGALRRKAIASIARDTWLLLDKDGNEIAKLQEDSLFLALLRRFILGALLPQSFTITTSEGDVVGICKQTFNPFVPQFNIDFSMDTARKLDRRIGIAAIVLLQIIEGKQSS